jgi:phage terminase large subunit GpA-like protein
MRKAKDRLEYDDERVRATMELILRHYLPRHGEDLPAPVAVEEPRMETHVRGIGEPDQSWLAASVVRARHELILRDYVPDPGEGLTAPVAVEEPRMETHVRGIEELEQSWPTAGAVRARRWA